MKRWYVFNAGTLSKRRFRTKRGAVAWAEMNTFGRYSVVRMESDNAHDVVRETYGTRWRDNRRTTDPYKPADRIVNDRN